MDIPYSVFEVSRKLKQLALAFLFLLIIFFGWLFPLLGYFIPLCMLLGLGLGLSRGRKWCDWFCPRGSFYDSLLRFKVAQKKIPALLKRDSFRIFVFVFLLAVMVFNLILRWPDPYKIGRFFVLLLTVTTALGLILTFIFHQRAWCSFCPVGSIIKWMGKKNNLVINSDDCVECNLCLKVCPMQIKPSSFKIEGRCMVRNNDCLRCNLCIAVCPKQALSR